MSHDRPPISDLQLERALAQRAAMGSDEGVLRTIVERAGSIPQDRVWWSPFGRWGAGPRLTLAWIVVALAGALTVGALVAGGMWHERPDLSVVAPPDPTNTSNPAEPSTEPSLTPSTEPTPAVNPSDAPGACPPSTIDVRTGDAMDPPALEPPFAGSALASGVFVTDSSTNEVPNAVTVWSSNGPGTTERLMTMHAAAEFSALVADVSADGAMTLVDVSTEPWPGLNESCSDLYIVGTDGSGLRLLSRFETYYGAPGPTFSPDGRRVAYVQFPDGLVAVIDVATGGLTAQPSGCGADFSSQVLAWSPNGDRVVMACSSAVVVLDLPTATTIEDFRAADGQFVLAAALDRESHLLIARTTQGLPTVEILRNNLVNGRSPVVHEAIMPKGRIAATAAFSPGATRLAIGTTLAVDSNKGGKSRTYLFDTNGTNLGQLDSAPSDVRWESDRPSGAYFIWDNSHDLQRVEVPSGHVTAIRLPFYYNGGIWRIP